VEASGGKAQPGHPSSRPGPPRQNEAGKKPCKKKKKKRKKRQVKKRRVPKKKDAQLLGKSLEAEAEAVILVIGGHKSTKLRQVIDKTAKLVLQVFG
jgi:hypothetical protein